ncbi:MAG: AMP-binding protein [Clostridiales bacterium]|nr:AMP-binding protein [Clostridiales bacterium]
MNFRTETNSEGAYILYLEGRIDTISAPQLRTAIADIPLDTGRVVLDFRDVPLVTSAGMREMVVCGRRFPGDRLLLRNVSADVLEIFHMVGFDNAFNIEKMEEDLSTYINHSFKEILSHQVREYGDLTVLQNDHDSYTWRDIDTASQIIASDLAAMGVGKGTHVGICGANSVNWVLTFYATQKLGAIAMLINPSQSAAEIGKICAIGDITVLCYGEIAAMKDEEAFIDEVCSCEGTSVSNTYAIRNNVDLKTRFSEIDALIGRFEQTVEADSPCTVIFTSGSTGKPKGVILSSYNLLNAASVQVKLQHMTDQDKNLLIVPLFHILGLVVCFIPCALKNAKLYIPDNIRTDNLISIMNRERCTLLHSVPTMIIALLNNEKFNKEDFASLRCTYLAGAAATEAQLKMFREKMPQNHFMIAYGLSEMAPVSVTLYDDDDDHILHTVGKPVENIQLRIIDRENGEILPDGKPGEILVQGFNLMTGYYKVAIGDQAIDDEGWLHTGDMGYIDNNGYLVLAGRYKELIIRGGENIMPSEVEAAITELPMIDNVKVIGVPSDFFGEEVGACITLKSGEVFDEQAVRGELLKRLAKYKVPSHFFVFDEFPMLGSGKIDGVKLKKEALERIRKQ